jgi:hypothetical protein
MAACAESNFIQQTIKNGHNVKTNRAKQKVSTGLKLAIFLKIGVYFFRFEKGHYLFNKFDNRCQLIAMNYTKGFLPIITVKSFMIQPFDSLFEYKDWFNRALT